MKALAWRLRWAAIHLGWGGMIGLLLLAGSAVGYGVVVRGDEARLRQLESQATSLRARIQQAERGGITLTGAEAQLAEFYGFFSTAGATVWLDKIYGAAAREGLVLEQGEYRSAPDKTGKLVRYQVTFPVKGSYLQVRRFIDGVLTDVPVAALEDVAFKREAVGSTSLEARVKFTLFLGAG
jgi:Tfp pilus assembly protein PilO